MIANRADRRSQSPSASNALFKSQVRHGAPDLRLQQEVAARSDSGDEITTHAKPVEWMPT